MHVQSVAEQLLYTTVRVETVKGTQGGCGTSFIVHYEHEGKTYPVLVTNKHVVEGAQEGYLNFTLAQGAEPDIGKGYRLHVTEFPKMWVGHPDPNIDITVALLGPILAYIQGQGQGTFTRGIGRDLFPTDDRLDEMDALEEVVFVGYPNGVWDSANLTPIIRKGVTATPISLDFQGKPTFLIDASVFPGSSGSPVFLYSSTGTYVDKNDGGVKLGNRLTFLGVVAEVLIKQDVNTVQFVTVPTAQVPIAVSTQMIDLGLVYKASTVREAIENLLRKHGFIESDQQAG